jgi:hypothetical protein
MITQAFQLSGSAARISARAFGPPVEAPSSTSARRDAGAGEGQLSRPIDGPQEFANGIRPFLELPKRMAPKRSGV